MSNLSAFMRSNVKTVENAVRPLCIYACKGDQNTW